MVTLCGCATVADLLPPPKHVAQIHLSGDHWSPKSPRLQGQNAPFGKTSPFTITVVRVTDDSGRSLYDRNNGDTRLPLLDSVFLDVPQGQYTVHYVCHVGSYPGLSITADSIRLAAVEGLRYIVGVYDVVENPSLPPQHPQRRRCSAHFDPRTI